ncbi:uncharacterized protein I303_103954 [Kwoniella dejecticola CBS 10117]|uniref:Probable vacuolar protein sorting-associated protein 16 homolog n=1 Tax=Kwoniella dejecticola CBS 10117 TaxID=1296121 RepID=A0A1A6A872_9TREE|nr:vacuolar protein sorting-associated protein [Kwoniella dejecticola CBS 10117]OBR86251.1 vacuolar protein sorting-associated protein [Kwoniella dejecticola CBS 10117]
MSLSSPTATWDTIQDVFYRKEDIYTMSWSIKDLSDYVVCAGKNGGPIAIIRDENKVLLSSRHSGKPKIQIYTSSGLPISTIPWELGTPALMHLTTTSLVVLAHSGIYRVYDLSNSSSSTSASTSTSTYKQYSLGLGEDEGVLGAKAYEEGMVILTNGLEFLEVRGWAGGRGVPLKSSGLIEPPTSWALLPPDISPTGHIQLIISTSSTIVTLDTLERIDQKINRGPFSNISISPNGKFLALITTSKYDRRLWVVSSDFGRNLSEVDLNQLHPSEIPEVIGCEWCGDNAIALSWEGRVVVVGPGGESLAWDYPPSVCIVGEIDGLRIISSSTCEFVQKVPDATLAVFSPGSSNPAAILYDALDHFERKSPKADESIRSIRPDLGNAVDTCIEAAGREIEVTWQRKLLKAAQFGRAFLDLYNPNDFVTMAQTLKVLNAVRYYEIGIPITYEQYMASSSSTLILHLISRNLHLLALRISQFLNLRPDPVLSHWASAKIIRSSQKGVDPSDRGLGDDESICKAIVDKFEKEGERGVSYAEIARKAWENGRARLATMLLDHEPRAAEQVPLLLQMKEEKIALEKAVDSGDTDLVYQVLLHLRSTLSPGDFFHILDDSISPKLKPAVNLLQVYARQADRGLLRDFYYQDDRRTESGCLEMEEASQQVYAEDRLDDLKKAAKAFGESKERQFESKMADDAHRLLLLQQTYEKELDHKFTFSGLSANAFIHKLLLEGFTKRAERVRSDWRVPDKRFWWIKLRALAERKDWEGLEAFAKSKKSPIGYEPFVTHLLSLTPPQPTHAASFVPRCDPRQRADLYVRCGDWGRAAESAKERNDRSKLDELKRRAPNGIAQREVDEVIRRVGK